MRNVISGIWGIRKHVRGQLVIMFARSRLVYGLESRAVQPRDYKALVKAESEMLGRIAGRPKWKKKLMEINDSDIRFEYGVGRADDWVRYQKSSYFAHTQRLDNDSDWCKTSFNGSSIPDREPSWSGDDNRWICFSDANEIGKVNNDKQETIRSNLFEFLDKTKIPREALGLLCANKKAIAKQLKEADKENDRNPILNEEENQKRINGVYNLRKEQYHEHTRSLYVQNLVEDWRLGKKVCSQKLAEKEKALKTKFNLEGKHQKMFEPNWCFVCEKSISTSFKEHARTVHGMGNCTLTGEEKIAAEEGYNKYLSEIGELNKLAAEQSVGKFDCIEITGSDSFKCKSCDLQLQGSLAVAIMHGKDHDVCRPVSIFKTDDGKFRPGKFERKKDGLYWQGQGAVFHKTIWPEGTTIENGRVWCEKCDCYSVEENCDGRGHTKFFEHWTKCKGVGNKRAKKRRKANEGDYVPMTEETLDEILDTYEKLDKNNWLRAVPKHTVVKPDNSVAASSSSSSSSSSAQNNAAAMDVDLENQNSKRSRKELNKKDEDGSTQDFFGVLSDSPKLKRLKKH